MSQIPKQPKYLTNFDNGRGAVWSPIGNGHALVATYWKNELEGTFTFAGAEPFLRHVRAMDELEACSNYLRELGKEPQVQLVSEA